MICLLYCAVTAISYVGLYAFIPSTDARKKTLKKICTTIQQKSWVRFKNSSDITSAYCQVYSMITTVCNYQWYDSHVTLHLCLKPEDTPKGLIKYKLNMLYQSEYFPQQNCSGVLMISVTLNTPVCVCLCVRYAGVRWLL